MQTATTKAAVVALTLSLCTLASAAEFPAAEQRIAEALEEGQAAGVVLGVVHRDRLIYVKAFGEAQSMPTVEPMTRETVFDLASLTKPLATGLCTMRLVQQHKLDVETPVAELLPEFAASGKDGIRIRHLLLHTSGLLPDNALSDYQAGAASAFQRIDALSLRAAPGERFIYSDVGFIVLARVVEAIHGADLATAFNQLVAAPLGLHETTFNPGGTLVARSAATEKVDDRFLKGIVHDPRARAMGGVAGHAGLFSTVDDIARIAIDLLTAARNESAVLLTPETFRLMTQPREIDRGTRTFGWDHRSPYSRNRGTRLSDAAFGHGGFTGTALWIDPGKELAVIFLSNRLHPDGKGSVNDVAGDVIDHVVQQLEPPSL